MDKDKQIQKVSKLSLEKLSEDSKLVKRGLRDLSIWPKIEELFAKLKASYKNEQINECINIAEEILQTDSNHFFTLCYYGRSLYLLGRYEEALKVLEKCLEDEKEYYFLWSFRGDVYYKMGKYAEAVADYEKSLKLELYEFWYRATGKERTTNDLKKKTPDSTDSLDNHMYYFSESDDVALDEIGYFRKALFYLSTNFESYQKDDAGIKRAIESLKCVLKDNPKNWYALNQLTGVSEFLAKKFIGTNNQEALVYIDGALKYAPDNMNLISIKAILLDALGDNEQAVKLIKLAKEKDPDNPDLDFVYKKIHRIE